MGQPVSEQAGPGTLGLLLTVGSFVQPGTYPITIAGQSSFAGETSSTAITLVVNAVTGPSVVSMSPNPGIQTTQIFTFTFTDPSGGASITSAGVLAGTSQSTVAACYVQYTASTQTVSLQNDAGTGWAGSAVLGTSGELSNSQCLLDTGASQASVSGNTLTLTLVLTPVVPVIGTQNVYATVSDSSSSSGWLQLGVWTISANSLPARWRDQDIGAVSGAGFSMYDPTSGTYTVYSYASDLNAPPDQLHYTYQPMVGDGTIVAQLTTVDNIFQYTKAGVMNYRASADPSDAYVFLNFQPNNGGCNVGIRGTSGAVATDAACSPSLPLLISPQYSAAGLQITRQGNTFSLQISSDGPRGQL